MQEYDLLSVVQPSEGWFAMLAIRNGVVQQRLLATREEVDAFVSGRSDSGWDVYFGVAKFATDANRSKENVLALKSFWIDIDCGEAKAAVNPKTGRAAGYATKEIALAKLKKFCDDTTIPLPIIVDSGRGIHAYWALTEEITREQWEPVAEKLKAMCRDHDLIVDPAVFEVARVLRVPDTFNYKDDPANPVTVLVRKDPYPLEAICAALGVEGHTPEKGGTGTLFGSTRRNKPSALGKALAGGDSMTCSFSKIIDRSRNGDGCQQLLHCVENRATLDYEMWHAALSIANKCQIDRDDGIRMVSEEHPNYDFADASAKAASFAGPRTCVKFEEINPGGCDKCPHKGKINTPIVLGYQETNVAVSYSVPMPENVGGSEERYTPTYTDPYYWAEGGGIYKRSKGEEGVATLVCEHHIYVVKRMDDPVLGDIIVLNLHLPEDGLRQIIVSAAHVHDDAAVRAALSSRGVYGGKKQFNHIVEYVQSVMRKLQYTKKAEVMRMQYGWADNNTKFIVGDREYTAAGSYHSPPSSATSRITPLMGKVGSYEAWQEVFNLYDQPGLEGNAFAALTAFGAPLLRFTGQSGGMINLIHPGSGTGKTTVLHMSNSVWGHPKELCGVKDDTAYTKIQRLGIHNNIHVTYDEITNMEAKDFSELIYCSTQGRGRDRMKASSNEMRANFTTWKTLALCSSNSSFYEKLQAYKALPDGEMMRLIEYTIGYSNIIPTALGKEMFDIQLMQNYGHAGPAFINWVLKNPEETAHTLASIQSKIDLELRLTQRERVWSGIMAANIAGGMIARKADVIDWDLGRIYRWIGRKLKDNRGAAAVPVTGAAAVIGDYINRHINNILVVDDGADQRSKMAMFPTMEPRGELLIRYEPDTKLLSIVAKPFQKDCVSQQINYRELISELTQLGVYKEAGNKRMTKGMKINAPAVYAITLDCSVSGFLDVEDIAAPENGLVLGRR